MLTKTITASDLAKTCGVSRSTVNRALLARSLAMGKSMTIGVIVADLNNQYFSGIIDAVGKRVKNEKHLHQKGYMLKREFGVMGFDYVKSYQNGIVNITTIDNYISAIGDKAAEILLDMINGKLARDEYHHEIIGYRISLRWPQIMAAQQRRHVSVCFL